MNRSLPFPFQQSLIYTFACLCLLFLLYPGSGATFPFSRNERRAEGSADESSPTPADSAAKLLRQQMINPAEILSVLLIIGGDIVQKACAQLSNAGPKKFPITPVAFSFGWVAFAFGALMSAFADGTMMPEPDITSAVAVVGGQRKINESWVIGRFIRDLELNNERRNPDQTPKLGGLCVKFYQANGESCKPHRDKIWWSFAFFMTCQFALAAAPLYHWNWSILMVTGFGTLLALVMGSLPQWKREKFHGRMSEGKERREKVEKGKAGKEGGKGKSTTYVLTRGNGHSHVFVIRVSEDDSFIRLDDLAISRPISHRRERASIVLLAALWILLLVMVGGMKQDAWFLLGVGIIGMVHNVIVAGFKRTPEAHGIPVKEVKDSTIDEANVFPAIKKAEEKSPGVGLSLMPIFLPDSRRPNEAIWMAEQERTLETRKATALQAYMQSKPEGPGSKAGVKHLGAS